MRFLPLLLLSVPVFGQEAVPARILRGDLVEWNVNRSGIGELAIRDSEYKLSRCRVSRETYLGRNTLRIASAGVRVGDHVEIEMDLRRGAADCFTTSLYIKPIEQARHAFGAARQPSVDLASRMTSPLSNAYWTRGNIAISGTVQAIDGENLILRTRSQGQFKLHLRRDTVFTTEGRVVERSELKIQQLVYVRIARGLTGELELHNVIWGEILNPRAAR
jgi:hypothetical protein